ncbi:MAG: LysM peptidoglycan-binding domain-containing protein [Myxococcales bacterium]|nr:LysM peptidoglycan-binding domain-containing protein [Myxococcales bacterium]MCB9737096.1 LysM peptidoglycan-binding domain-containing protein [Deltaproteobacteria bacterium]
MAERDPRGATQAPTTTPDRPSAPGDEAAAPPGGVDTMIAAGGNQSMVAVSRGDAGEIAPTGAGTGPSAAPMGEPDADRDPRDPTSLAGALSHHSEKLALFKSVIRRALATAPDPEAPESRATLLRNSAQWLAQGEATPYVLTPTHDSHRRRELGDGERAYFDQTASVEQGGGRYVPRESRDAAPAPDAGIHVGTYSAAGFMTGDGQRLVLIDPPDEKDVEETLIHEVQHDADLHDEGEAFHDARGGKERAIHKADASYVNAYQSELRAYWANAMFANAAGEPGRVEQLTIRARSPGADLDYGTSDDQAPRAVTTGFDNPRQAAIFAHLLGGKGEAQSRVDWFDADPDSASNWLTPYGYVAHYYVWDPAFRAMVDAYTVPEGGNLINSVRIQRLVVAAEGGDHRAVLEAAARLDGGDRAYLADEKIAADFWSTARGHLEGDALGDLEAIVAGRVDAAARLAERFPGTEAPAEEGADAVPEYLEREEVAPSGGDPRRIAVIDAEEQAAEGQASSGERSGGGRSGGGRIAPIDATPYVVQRNDTLGKIAEKELGDRSRWREIAALNPDKCSPPRYEVRRGVTILLPARD